jgi:hypothetical protein
MRNAPYLMPGKQCLANIACSNTSGNMNNSGAQTNEDLRKCFWVQVLCINSLSRMETILFYIQYINQQNAPNKIQKNKS